MRKLRLLYLLPAEGFGGAERQGVYHLKELPRHGVDVTAIVGPGDAIARALDASEVPHERFMHFPDRTPAPGRPFGHVGYWGRWIARLVRSTAEIERRMRKESFDLIFANRTIAWLVAASLSRRVGVPYVIRAGSRVAHPALALGLPVLDHAAKPAAVFSNCHAVERAIASHFHAPRYWCPNAVDPDSFTPGPSSSARARLGLGAGSPLIGLAARPAPEKGLEFFARIVARVRKARRETRFVVAGEFGFRTHYESVLRRAGLGDAVQFLGHVEAMPEFFRAVDIAVLTSRAQSIEASPNALLEAMATGRPIVATAVGGVPELIRHGSEGYLTSEDDDRSFADRILELLDAPSRRAAFGAAGRERAVSRHALTAVVEALARDLRVISSTFPTSETFAAPALKEA